MKKKREVNDVNRWYALAVVLLVAVAFVAGSQIITKEKVVERVLGSVATGEAYTSTTTAAQAGLANYANLLAMTGSAYPTSTPGVLGSVVITTLGTAPWCLYDATSTKTNADWATTTIACFKASAPEGTYTFDIQLKKGLLIEFGDSTILTRASSTITYRVQ